MEIFELHAQHRSGRVINVTFYDDLAIAKDVRKALEKSRAFLDVELTKRVHKPVP